MTDHIVFTEKVRHPQHEGQWIPLKRVLDDGEGNITAIQHLDESGEPISIGTSSIGVYFDDGVPIQLSPINPVVTKNTTTPTTLGYSDTFNIIENFEVDSYGRLTEINLQQYQLPENPTEDIFGEILSQQF